MDVKNLFEIMNSVNDTPCSTNRVVYLFFRNIRDNKIVQIFQTLNHLEGRILNLKHDFLCEAIEELLGVIDRLQVHQWGEISNHEKLANFPLKINIYCVHREVAFLTI